MRRYWTDDEVAILRTRYADERTDAIARDLGRKTTQVYNKAYALGLVKSEAFLASDASGQIRPGERRGEATQFGSVPPWNKGRSFRAGGRSVETQFKKGQRTGRANALYQPIGTERVSCDGYLERKVNDDLPMNRRWRAVHILNWEAVNGPVPKGHALVFRDGNKRNVDPANLELVSRAELMRRNTVHRYPAHIKTAIRAVARVSREINKQRGRS